MLYQLIRQKNFKTKLQNNILSKIQSKIQVK